MSLLRLLLFIAVFILANRTFAFRADIGFWKVTPTSTGCLGGGVLYGGYCWYASYLSQACWDACPPNKICWNTCPAQSCVATCAAHGGVNDATRDFVGSAGTLANCTAVLDKLNLFTIWGSAKDILGNAPHIGYGCIAGSIGGRWRDNKIVTDYNNVIIGYYNVCACNN